MLDKFSVEDTRKAVELIGGKFEIESSGDITFDTLRDYAECGVDFISVGALTHSVSKRIRDAALYTCLSFAMARTFVQVRAEAKLAWIMPSAAESLKEKRTFKNKKISLKNKSLSDIFLMYRY